LEVVAEPWEFSGKYRRRKSTNNLKEVSLQNLGGLGIVAWVFTDKHFLFIDFKAV